MKKFALLLVLLVSAAPVFAAPAGFAAEAFSDGTVGIGYYQPTWAAGVAGSFSSAAANGLEGRTLQVAPWVEARAAVGPKTDVFAGVSLGIGLSGVNDNQTITDDYTPGLFAGVDYQLSEKLLVQGYSSYTVRSFKAGSTTATSSDLSATLGLSYFF